MKICIIGSKGIPASYGGFETLAEYLSVYLVNSGHEVTVFCSGGFKREKFKGVNLVYLPFKANKFQGIIYDLMSILLSISSQDKIIMLGSPAGPLLGLIPGLRKKLIFNFGGLDFKRNKWNRYIQNFISYGKKNALKYSNIVVADNQGIFDYLVNNYTLNIKKIFLIEYGGNHAEFKCKNNFQSFYKLPEKYSLTIARIQKDNNIELIIKSAIKYKFNAIIIGNWNFETYGKALKLKYKSHENIFLLDPIYEIEVLFRYRKNCTYYIHGHSAGGTNPTLVEAMWLGLNIFAFDNVFNRHTTEDNSNYWSNLDELGLLIQDTGNNKISNNSHKMKSIAHKRYNWDLICEKYLKIINL
ncbi:MAG: DUF1972 domain-containing protein [Polaribacter sp.]|nr:DUF1972 domain-containing protein [Polaribacter sp.]